MTEDRLDQIQSWAEQKVGTYYDGAAALTVLELVEEVRRVWEGLTELSKEPNDCQHCQGWLASVMYLKNPGLFSLGYDD